MRRYLGEAIAPDARIALITNDALGNYVVATPLMQMLRAKYPEGVIHYFGGTRTTELSERAPWFDVSVSFYGSEPRALISGLARAAAYDLVINVENSPWASCLAAILAGQDGFVCGPCLSDDGRAEMPYGVDLRGELWRDTEWLARSICATYPFLATGFIGEIFVRLAYLDGPVPRYSLPADDPGRPVPDVLISTAASLSKKLWPPEKWVRLLQELRQRGLTIGLVGAKPMDQSKFWQGAGDEQRIITDGGAEDLRGVMSLPQVVGALSQCRQVVTIDNGVLHLACATETPVVGLFRNGIHRLWAPPSPNLTVLEPGEGNDVASLSVEQVLESLSIL